MQSHSVYWRVGLALAGALFIPAGILHPPGRADVSFEEHTAVMLAGDTWVISHIFQLLTALLLLGSLTIGRRDPSLRDVTGRALPFAIGGVVIWSVESLVHLLAYVDLEALRAGGSTPVLSTHLSLSVIGYPVAFLPLAVIALRIARGWSILLRPLGWIGAAACTAFALAAPVVVVSGDQSYAFLFPIGAGPASLWMMLVGAIGLRVPVAEPEGIAR